MLAAQQAERYRGVLGGEAREESAVPAGASPSGRYEEAWRGMGRYGGEAREESAVPRAVHILVDGPLVEAACRVASEQEKLEHLWKGEGGGNGQVPPHLVEQGVSQRLHTSARCGMTVTNCY